MEKQKKPILYFDMDGVLVDFRSGIKALGLTTEQRRQHEQANDFDEIPGIFSLMQPTYGAVCAVKHLSRQYDVRILTTAPWNNPSAWSDKLLWVKKYFDGVIEPDEEHPDGNPFHKRITITHDKERLLGHILVEDRLVKKSGASAFLGEKIWFHYPRNTHAACEEHLLMVDVKEVTNWYDLLEYLMPNDPAWRADESALYCEGLR